MRFSNESGLPASWTMGFQRDGREMLIVIAKATYSIPTGGGDPVLAEVPVPLVEADQFSGEPGLSAPVYETDYAHRKLLCDVLLVGSAYAPPGGRVTRTEVGLRVGAAAKRFAVVGERRWIKGSIGIRASDPEPFDVIPITYNCAFGGTDRTREKEGRTATYLANPVGRGYWRYTDQIDGRLLPNTEEVDRSVVAYNGMYKPMAFSPIGRNWVPRVRYAGTYDQHWIENTAPLWPDDFDERYFQSAPPDQTVPFPQGGGSCASQRRSRRSSGISTADTSDADYVHTSQRSRCNAVRKPGHDRLRNGL